jgi:hypothetical protein
VFLSEELMLKRLVGYSLFYVFIIFAVSCGGSDISSITSEEELNDEIEAGVVLMNNERMHDLLQRIDPELQGQLGSWVISHDTIKAQVITDERADRMRVIVPIIKLEDIEEGELLRLMQANFDSSLDARYSVANGVVWSAFIHPLSELSDEEFISGLAQAITAANTFGSTYSSGALIFGSGDSSDQQREYYESILEKGLAI